MPWQNQLRGDSVSWLLDPESSGVRYLALRNLMELPAEDKELKSTRKLAHKEGPIAEVLSHMEDAGEVIKLAKDYDRVQKEMDVMLAEWEGLQ